MNHKKLIGLLLLCLLTALIPFVSAHDVSVPTNVYFGLPTYGTRACN